MGGGLMQLVAYGAQDVYLTGNPQITFFKVVYRRHTNFSMESIEQTLNGSVGYGNKVTCTISRNGDLVTKLVLEATISASEEQNVVGPNPGSAIINEVELEIGGQRIDKHYGHWMETWAELTQVNPSGHSGFVRNGAAATINAGTQFQNTAGYGGVVGNTNNTMVSLQVLYIPFQFFFCRNPGLALPLIALQYHEVKINLTFGAAVGVMEAAGTPALAAKLFADYIYLDTDERRRFAQVSHEYLIEQLQYQLESANATKNLNFNHPVKELIWTGATTATATALVGPSTPEALESGNTYLLKLNGHDRFSARDITYFTRCQVGQHHSGYGGISIPTQGTCNTATSVRAEDSIAVYSFALKPEEHQPSGTCNFSRIDNAQLISAGGTAEILNIYAINYNVLRIMSGMGGLAYSN
jgi:hypothetical protein